MGFRAYLDVEHNFFGHYFIYRLLRFRYGLGRRVLRRLGFESD